MSDGAFAAVGWWEVVVMLAVALLLFGSAKIPELARGLGRAVRIFRDEIAGRKTGDDAGPAPPAPKPKAGEQAEVPGADEANKEGPG